MAMEERNKKNSSSKRKSNKNRASSRMKNGRSRNTNGNTYNAIKSTVANVEERFEEDVVNKVFSDQMVSDAEIIARRFFRAVGNTVKTASEQNICDTEMSVITDAQTYVSTIGTGGFHNGASRVSGMSVSADSSYFARNQMKDETCDRRDQISSYIQTNIPDGHLLSKERTNVEQRNRLSCVPTHISTRKSSMKSNKLLKNNGHEETIPTYISEPKSRCKRNIEAELVQVKAELESAFASFVKLEADKIAIKQYYGREIRTISNEMKNAEKLYEKEKSMYEETIDEQKAKTNKLKDELSRMKVKLMATSNISTLTEDTQQLTLANEIMKKDIESNCSMMNGLETKLLEKDREIEQKDKEIENLRKQLEMNKSIGELHQTLKQSISHLKKNSLEKENEAKQEELCTTDSRSFVSDESFSTLKGLVQSLMKEIQTLTTENNVLYNKLQAQKLSTSNSVSSASCTIGTVERCLENSIAVHQEVEDEIKVLQKRLLVKKNESPVGADKRCDGSTNSLDESTISASDCSKSRTKKVSLGSPKSLTKRDQSIPKNAATMSSRSSTRSSGSAASIKSSISSFSSTNTNINLKINSIGKEIAGPYESITNTLADQEVEVRDEVSAPSFDKSAPSFDEGKAREVEVEKKSENWVSFGETNTIFG